MSQTQFDPIETFNALAVNVIGNVYVIDNGTLVDVNLQVPVYNTIISLTLLEDNTNDEQYIIQLVGDVGTGTGTITECDVHNIKEIISVVDNKIIYESTNGIKHLIYLDYNITGDTSVILDKFIEYTTDIYQSDEERCTYQRALMWKLFNMYKRGGQ